MSKKINPKNRYYFTDKGAKNNWVFVTGRHTVDAKGGASELLKEIKKHLGLNEKDNKQEYIANQVTSFLDNKGSAEKLSVDKLRTFKNSADESYPIIRLTADILASYLKNEFISYEDWNSERKKATKPSSLSDTPWYCYLLGKHKQSPELAKSDPSLLIEDKTYCILRYWFKTNGDFSFVRLKSSNREYTGEGRPFSGYFHFSLKEKHSSNPIFQEIYLNYPIKNVQYIEGFMITGTTQTQLTYKRILFESAPGSKMPIKKTEIKLLVFHTKEYYKAENKYLRIYFSKISKHIQHTAPFGITDETDAIESANKHNRPKKAYLYDLYISSMATSDEEKNIAVCQEIGQFIISLLTDGYGDKNGIKQNPIFKKDRIYAPALMDRNGKILNVQAALNNEKSKTRYKEGRRDFHIAKHHMLLMPFDKRSAAYDQSTWCFYRSQKDMKRCVSIVGNKDSLSKLFTQENFGDRGFVVELGINSSLQKMKKIIKENFANIRRTYESE